MKLIKSYAVLSVLMLVAGGHVQAEVGVQRVVAALMKMLRGTADEAVGTEQENDQGAEQTQDVTGVSQAADGNDVDGNDDEAAAQDEVDTTEPQSACVDASTTSDDMSDTDDDEEDADEEFLEEEEFPTDDDAAVLYLDGWQDDEGYDDSFYAAYYTGVYASGDDEYADGYYDDFYDDDFFEDEDSDRCPGCEGDEATWNQRPTAGMVTRRRGVVTDELGRVVARRVVSCK